MRSDSGEGGRSSVMYPFGTKARDVDNGPVSSSLIVFPALKEKYSIDELGGGGSC